MKKYELTEETKYFFGVKLFRIRALISFSDIKKGELGGFVQKEGNLSQSGNAWVYGDARIYGDAYIFWISGIGSRSGTTTFFLCHDKRIRVSCGCFYGDLDEFYNKVQSTHGGNRFGDVYRIAIEMAKAHIVIPDAICDDVSSLDSF